MKRATLGRVIAVVGVVLAGVLGSQAYGPNAAAVAPTEGGSTELVAMGDHQASTGSASVGGRFD